MGKSRILFRNQMNTAINYTKAIGIICVVLGHALFSYMEWFVQLLNMFHVPLFFFVSGYCFKDKYLLKPWGGVKRRVKNIYIPYVKWSLIFILLHNLFFKINIYNSLYGYRQYTSHLYGLDEIIKYAIMCITKMDWYEQLLGAFWFMKPMFWGSLIMILLIVTSMKLLNFSKYSKHYPLFALLANAIFVFFLGFTYWYIPFFNIGVQCFYCSSIILCGYVFKYYKIKEFTKARIVLSIILLFIGTFLWPQSLNQYSYNLYYIVPYFVTSILTTWSIYSICKKIHECHILNYIGKNTMSIFTLHFLCFKLVSLAIILIYGLQIERLAEFYTIEKYSHSLWFIPYTIVGVFLPLLLLEIYKSLKRISK